MGVSRIVNTAFWTDGKVDEFSPEDKYFMLYLLTNPFTRQLGIYEISIKQAAFHMGYSIDAFNVLLERFENKYKMIVFSKETNEIAVLNFLRHSVMKGGKPVEDCIRKDMEMVKNKKLIDIVFSHIQGKKLNDTVQKIVSQYLKENDNDNDNDNDRTEAVSYHDSSKEKKKGKKKEPKVYVDDPELNEAILNFAEFRKNVKKPMTDHAVKLLITKLNGMTTHIPEQIEILNQSIMNGWQGVFPLKEQTQQRQTYHKQTKADELNDFYDMARAWAGGSNG